MFSLNEMSIRVLIADDHRIFREGLHALLENEADIEVVGETADGREAVELAQKLSPAVVIMGAGLPNLSGIEATRQILAYHPHTKVIGLAIHSDVQFVLKMLRAGASGCLLKDCCQEDLARAIRAVDSHITFLSAEIAHIAAEEHLAYNPADNDNSHDPILSGREREVLKLMAEGKSTKEIAVELEISVKTVETYRSRIRSKLNLHSLAELTKYAIREGLIDLDS